MAPSHRTTFWRQAKTMLLTGGVSLGIWIATAWMMHWMLNHSYPSTIQLQTDFYPQTHLSRTLTITAIQARVNRHNHISEITLTTTNSTLKRLEFKFPFTEITTLETALARELNSSSKIIQSLIRYHID